MTTPTVDRRPSCFIGSDPVLRSACIGDTRDALRDGRTDAAIVTKVPTPKQTMIVRGSTWVAPAGISIPRPANSALRPAASRIPIPNPTADASIPTKAASAITDLTIWLRDAPIARINPISLVLCATMIEKVLKMMNEPTKSDISAKARSAVLKKESC